MAQNLQQDNGIAKTYATKNHFRISHNSCWTVLCRDLINCQLIWFKKSKQNKYSYPADKTILRLLGSSNINRR